MVPFPHVFKLSGPTRLSRSEVDVSIHKCGISVVTPNGGPFSGMPRGVCCILGTLPSSPLSPLKKGGLTVIQTPFEEASAEGFRH